jgi:predicted enzyme related to lactoylglutathione lyase
MSSIVWFEIPADDVERAKSFYGALFAWKIEIPWADGILAYRHWRQ